MKQDFINKISALKPYVFFDESKNMVTIHFINDSKNKPDIMAYLLVNNSWDVREVVDEKSTLHANSDIIEIIQRPMGIYEPGSAFDEIAKKCITAAATSSVTADTNSVMKDALNIDINKKLN